MVQLESRMRPRGINYRRFAPGLDLPSWFYYGLKAVDNDFHLVYHPYEVMWETIINQYEGELEDPRLTIHRQFGEMVFGHVFTHGITGVPTPDHSWHIWRYCDPHGWAHILKIESGHGHYLKLALNRIYLQGRFTDRYGARAWTHKLGDDEDARTVKMQDDKEEIFQAVNDENSWLLDKAADNFSRGFTQPTNPQKEMIFSTPGVMKRTKTSRPLSDEEGGLVTS